MLCESVCLHEGSQYTPSDLPESSIPPFDDEEWNCEEIRMNSVLHQEDYVIIDITKVQLWDEIRAILDDCVLTLTQKMLVCAPCKITGKYHAF